MIEPEDYILPHPSEQRPEPTDEERRQAAETLAYLESMPWRPHGIEW